MHLLSQSEINQVAGGSFTIHVNTSMPLNYVPIVTKFFEETGGVANMETVDVDKLIATIEAAGLDPSLLQVEINVSYIYGSYF